MECDNPVVSSSGNTDVLYESGTGTVGPVVLIDGNIEQDDDDETNSDSDETDDESESEDEPMLKYDRIYNDLSTILSNDDASCFIIRDKFIALGTQWGIVHVLDHHGNNITEKEFSSHSTIVNQISMDVKSDVIVSCSDDGRVRIVGLCSDEDNLQLEMDCPIKAVAVDPMFQRANSSKQFVVGVGDKLLMIERTWLNRNKTTLLQEGEGVIRNIKWRGNFIAWANDLGVKIYDVEHKERISYIQRAQKELRPELYRCNLCWQDDITLLIGWGNDLKICHIKERSGDPMVQHHLPAKCVVIDAMFETDFYISGLAPWKDMIVCLAYITGEPELEDEGEVCRPQIQLIKPHSDTYEVVSKEILKIRGFERCLCSSYHLDYTERDNTFYILSPKDLMVAHPRDEDDHIDWMLERHKFSSALASAEVNQHRLKRYNLLDIGEKYIRHLMDEGDYSEAGKMCVKVLGKNRDRWEKWVVKFESIKQLKAIAPYVPRGDHRLSPLIYEIILNEYLRTESLGFLQLIQEWPCDLYDTRIVINAVIEQMKDCIDAILLKALAKLYEHNRQFEKALPIYLELKDDQAFPLIYQRNLFLSIHNMVLSLMHLNKELALKLFLENVDRIPVEMVVKQLTPKESYLHLYLDKLFLKNHQLGEKYHGLQVRLYAENEPDKLLPFLRNSNYYPLQKAYQECEKKGLTREMVYLLARMGNKKQALELIVENLKNVDQAIEFAKEQDEPELWDELIERSLDKPSFITGLLQNIGTHVDPVLLINKIPHGLEIPGLKNSLVKILQDYNLQISLREGCCKILVADSFSLLQKLLKMQKKGIIISEQTECCACNSPVYNRTSTIVDDIITFNCHHVFHSECFHIEQQMCPICHAADSRRPRVSSDGSIFTM